jgi:hypothetical protein
MLLSIKTGGVIEFQHIEKTFSEELALILDEEVINVEVTLAFMNSNGLMEDSNSEYFILPFIPELIGSEGDSAERVRKLRENKKNIEALQCNTEVTMCNTEIEIREKREEIELDKRDITCDALVVDIVKESYFDTFWKAYPKKVGKDAALKAWNKKKHKPHMEFILEAIERYKLSKTVRDGYTCNPATWINEGRWSDEVTLSDYDKAKAIQEHMGMSPSETLDIQLQRAQEEWELGQ